MSRRPSAGNHFAFLAVFLLVQVGVIAVLTGVFVALGIAP